MNRDFSRLNIYLNRLASDIYEQPEDGGHTRMAQDVFDKWFAPYREIKTLLDAGCGDTAFMRERFESIGITYTGIAMGVNHPNVVNKDFTFTDFADESFDCVFSRHSLEHSPMPVITLMEWYRISKAWLCLILPNPNVYGWAGKNHYSVMNTVQVTSLFERAGWNIIWTDETNNSELRFMCEKIRKVANEER